MSSDYIGIELSGAAELERAFDALGAVGSKQALERALVKAAQPIAEEARRLAPQGTAPKSPHKKRIATSILVRTRLAPSQMRKRGGRREFTEVFVGSSAPHAHLVEFGHAIVTRSGRVVGFAARRPFLRPAFDAQKIAAVKIFRDVLWQEMVRVARRYAGQAERGRLSRGAREVFRAELDL